MMRMLNMSNQFYDYLSTKLLNYFDENNLLKGDRFFISFNEDEHVECLYESLKKIGKSKSTHSDFFYTHEVSGKKYKTYSIEINGIRLVVSESLSINDNYLVTLRNKVTSQKDDWENTALLIICKESIDSINKGMKDLQKKGMPLNIKSISNNLEEEIKLKDFDDVDRAIVSFALDVLEEDVFQTTLWDYEAILSIINSGTVTNENLRELHLFNDDDLNPHLSPKNMKKRLKDNHDLFNEVNQIKIFNEDKKLKDMFTNPGVKLLSRDNWYESKYNKLKDYKEAYENLKKPLNYIESKNKKSENGLIFWERPNSFNGKDNQRTRNIIVFNDNSSSEVSLKFTFDRPLSNDYVYDYKEKEPICRAKGKSLFINFPVNPNEPTFKWVRYKHRNQNNSNFKFRIAVLNIKPEMIESIKSIYRVNKKEIEITIDEDSFEIEFGLNSFEKRYIPIDEDGEIVYLHENGHISISEESEIWRNEKFKFSLSYKNNSIPFLVKQKHDPPNPRKSYFIWNLKRKNKENFIFNGKTAVQDVNSFSLYKNFKEYLKMEEEIIEKRIFYAKKNIDGSLTKEPVSFSKDLEEAYLDILDYYYNYDNSRIDNLPSLFYLNDELREKYVNFIDIFNKEISEIESNCILSDFNNKKDLLKIGRVDTENKIMYTPLSPLNIAYQLEIDDQCKNESFPPNISKRLVPNNLIPYIYSDNGNELFRPIYQDDAHEWSVYEKSEQVSIGTTNAFISNVVNEKLVQFEEHFSYLFSFNNPTPIKINLINIKDDKEVVKGIFKFIRNRLPDKSKTKNIIPVEINIYGGSEKTYFDNLFDCQSETRLNEEFSIKNLKTNMFDAIDVIHMVQDNISYYKHQSKKEYEYAHISFFKVESQNDKAVDDYMDKVETGLSLNGLLSSVSSTAKKSGYRLGFGTKNILNNDNLLVKTAINLNELAKNSKDGGMGSYSKKRSISTIVKLDGDNIEELTKKSHWVTFIEPTFGLEYFDSFDDDLIIIHYSDQYSSSNKYDTITVTNKSDQYEEIIRDFLKSKNVKFPSEIDNELNNVIKIFNSINGEWLLKIISNSEPHYDAEKLSIISAIKYCLAILDHDDIIWIPVSMEEILRIAGNVKLDRSEGIFADLLKGSYSDDLLFIGVKFNEDDRLEVIFYPIEVKIGQNNSSTMKKGKNQLKNTYELLKSQLQKENTSDSEFQSKFYRNFFIQLLLSNEQKLVTNNIWNEKMFDRIENIKDKLLNDDYNIIFGLEDYAGIGSVFSFKDDCYRSRIYMESNKQVIEIPKDYAYPTLITPIEKIHHEIQSNNTDINAETLLSHQDITELGVSSNYGNNFSDDVEMHDENENEDGIDDFKEESTEEVEVLVKEEDPNTENELTEEVDEHSYNNSHIRALIGTQKGYSHKVYWEFGHPKLSNRHMLIQGKSGQGKTYFIQRMLKELSKQGIPSIIIDYTDGFKKSKLEDSFKESLGDKLEQHLVYSNKFPLNPFKRNLIELDDDEYAPENDVLIASRFKSVVNSVYKLGHQQSNTIYNAVLKCLKKYGEEMDLSNLKEELLEDDSPYSPGVLNNLSELFDINPFESNKFDWSNVLDNNDGKVLIIQLTGLSKDIQKVISEFILWDLWYYKKNTGGSKDKPFIVVLDEAHNLDFSEKSPCSYILIQGRNFGWSGWFATQSIKGNMKPDEISKFDNADEKIYFHPTDVSDIAKELSQDNEERKRYEKELSQLTNGHCIVQGAAVDSDGKLYYQKPITVKVDKIDNEKI